MVKLQAPVLSLDASGSIADSIVFSKWKGRPYARALVKPANPRSGGQVGMRAVFKFLSQQWASISAGNQATWETRADQQIVSPFNAYMGYNQFRARDFLAPSQHDPADTADTLAVAGAGSATAGVRSITVQQNITTANDGWGVMFFRSTSTGFSTAYDNLIAIVEVDGVNPVVYVDSPLDPDTYYYNMRTITDDGQKSAEIGEVNATVT